MVVFIYFGIFQAGGFPEPEIIHYNPKDFDFGKKKSFPFRDQVKLVINMIQGFNYKEVLV